MHKPHGRYDYCTDIKSTIFGAHDEKVALFHDFECEVDIDVADKGHNIDPICTDVYIYGVSMRFGDDFTRAVRLKVMEAVDAELEAAGPIWDKVREAEGLAMIGQPGDPDARWVRS